MKLSIIFLVFYVFLLCLVQSRMNARGSLIAGGSVVRKKAREHHLAAVLPGAGGPVTGTLTIGVMNGISLFSNILLARFALSWFPQLTRQFPFLRPINTVTEPYLRIFRQVIPPIGGFDISAIPALFILDILSQTTAAVGATIPDSVKSNLSSGDVLKKQQREQLEHKY